MSNNIFRRTAISMAFSLAFLPMSYCVIAQDLDGNNSEGKISLNSPVQKYRSIYGWTQVNDDRLVDAEVSLVKVSANNVYGAFLSTSLTNSVFVANNKVLVKNFSVNSASNSNLLGVSISGQTDIDDITVTQNIVKIEGRLTGNNGSTFSVKGAYVNTQSSNAQSVLTVQNNEVIFDNVTQNNLNNFYITGGSGSANGQTKNNISGNRVDIKNQSRLQVFDKMLIEGGRSYTSGFQKVEKNLVNLSNSQIYGDALLGLYGGSAYIRTSFASDLIEVVENSVVIDHSIIKETQKNDYLKYIQICGGFSTPRSSVTQNLKNNLVQIKNSNLHAETFINISGAYTFATGGTQRLSGNVVQISDTTMTATNWVIVAGGSVQVLTNDTKVFDNQVQVHNVNMGSATVFGGMYGNNNSIDKGNSIQASGVNTLFAINGFETLFIHVDDANIDKPVLTLSDTLTFVDRKINVGTVPGFTVKGGSTYKLLNAPTISDLSEENISLENTWVRYDSALSIQDGGNNTQDLLLTTIAAQTTDNAKTLAESLLGTVAFVNQGAEYIADQGIQSALNALEGTNRSAFGAIQGSSLRYDTGSHVDVDGASMVVGYATKVNNSVLAAFIESGWATSDSHVNTAQAEADHDYYGLGVALHHSLTDQVYLDASLRAGWAETEFDGVYAHDQAHYDSKALYSSAHIGAGVIVPVTTKMQVDLYGRYFVSYLDSDDVTLDDAINSQFHMDSTVAHTVRMGARLQGDYSEIVSWSTGLAYEHVWNGDAESKIDQIALSVPSIDGGTGILEVNMSVKPDKQSAWAFDIGAKGYVGSREGVVGNMAIHYAF